MRREFHHSSHWHSIVVAVVVVLDPYFRRKCVKSKMIWEIVSEGNLNFRELHYYIQSIIDDIMFVAFMFRFFGNSFSYYLIFCTKKMFRFFSYFTLHYFHTTFSSDLDFIVATTNCHHTYTRKHMESSYHWHWFFAFVTQEPRVLQMTGTKTKSMEIHFFRPLCIQFSDDLWRPHSF